MVAAPNIRCDRYTFNGMERDDEVKGSGNSYTTEFRQYDPRLGRWLSIDPVTHPHMSPYNAFDNNPIIISDPSGANGDNASDNTNPSEELSDSESGLTNDLVNMSIENMLDLPNSSGLMGDGLNSSNSSSQGSSPTLTIVAGGINDPNSQNTKRGPNNIDIVVTVTGGKDIQKLEFTQFVIVSNDDEFDENDAEYNKGILLNQGKYFAMLDVGQNGNISFMTDEEIDEYEANGRYGIFPDRTEAASQFNDNGMAWNDVNDSYKKSYMVTYVSVINSEGVRQVVGKFVYGFVKSNGKISPDLNYSPPKVYQLDDFSDNAKIILGKNGITP